jgi:hypothetical protein
MITKKMPTPEMQAAHDAAYMQAVQGPEHWNKNVPTADPSNKEQVMLLLAWQMGQLAGMDDWALKNGVQTSFLGHGPSGQG